MGKGRLEHEWICDFAVYNGSSDCEARMVLSQHPLLRDLIGGFSCAIRWCEIQLSSVDNAPLPGSIWVAALLQASSKIGVVAAASELDVMTSVSDVLRLACFAIHSQASIDHHRNGDILPRVFPVKLHLISIPSNDAQPGDCVSSGCHSQTPQMSRRATLCYAQFQEMHKPFHHFAHHIYRASFHPQPHHTPLVFSGSI
jgi:hypothetical protein